MAKKAPNVINVFCIQLLLIDFFRVLFLTMFCFLHVEATNSAYLRVRVLRRTVCFLILQKTIFLTRAAYFPLVSCSWRHIAGACSELPLRCWAHWTRSCDHELFDFQCDWYMQHVSALQWSSTVQVTSFPLGPSRLLPVVILSASSYWSFYLTLLNFYRRFSRICLRYWSRVYYHHHIPRSK